MEKTLQNSSFQGRKNLKRTLTCRNASAYEFGINLGISLCFAVIPVMSFFMTEDLSLHIALALPMLMGCLYFAYQAWVTERKSHIRVTVHDTGFTYEYTGRETMEIQFHEIAKLRFENHQWIKGFFIELKTGRSFHIPANLERVDYILDTIRFYSPESCDDKAFMDFRENALVEDHILAHNRDYFSRHQFKAIWFYLAYPVLFKHEKNRIHESPDQVRRDMEFEKGLEKQFQVYYRTFSVIFLTVCIAWFYYR
jgi:hypothetical protein